MNICRTSTIFLWALVVLIELVAWSTSVANAGNSTIQRFDFGDFSPLNAVNLVLYGNATVENNVLQLLPTSLAWNRSGPSLGKIVYKDPIRMLNPNDSSVAASWSTSFVFKMVPQTEDGGADGMVFIMVADPTISGDVGGDFGIFRNYTAATPTFAVEFDTWPNKPYLFRDVQNNNHVGVDINRTTSDANRTADDINVILNSGRKIRAWIDYDHASNRLEIRMSYNVRDPEGDKPPDPFISHIVDMSKIVTEQMWIGFGASTYTSYQFHSIHSWSFSSKFSNDTGNGGPYGLESTSDSKVWSQGKLIKASAAAGASTIGFFLVLFLCLVGFKWYKRRGRAEEKSEKVMYDSCVDGVKCVDPEYKLLDIFVESPHSFSYKQLSNATEDFSEKWKLGGGGFGSVYRGVLASASRPDTPPRKVAVKRLSHDSKQGPREFLSEINIINCLRHRNLVQLLGWCQDEKHNELLLVYEFLPNGSLDKHLFFRSAKDPILPWCKRFSILRGIAAALEYLHEGSLAQVIHRDVKCSNVMLDENYNAKLGDFGLARVVDHAPYTTRPAGSLGYIAPETYQAGKATLKSDVYSFGAILLEVACGRRALDMSLCDFTDDSDGFLVDWVWSLYADKGNPDRILDAADKRLHGSFDVCQMKKVLELGLLCSNPDPDGRPRMRQVVQILAGEVPLPPVPTNKPVPVYISACLEVRPCVPR